MVLLYLKKHSKYIAFHHKLCYNYTIDKISWRLALSKVSMSEIRAIKVKRYGVLSGLANAAANFLTLILAGFENASVLFPIISAGTILASLLCGRLWLEC